MIILGKTDDVHTMYAWLYLSGIKQNATVNYKKHGISFEEAQTVFYDDFNVQFVDEEESTVAEDRFLMLGMSS